MPLVPEASCGRIGVLSQTSTPEHTVFQRHVIVFQVNDADVAAKHRGGFEDLSDDRFTAVIARMSLAGIDQLEGPDLPGDAF